MFTLPRYVAQDALKPTLLGLFAMVGIVWLLQSLRFLDLMINKGLELDVFLHLTLLLVPLLLTMIVPLSLFVGTCAMLRRWQEDSELTALLATGRSPVMLLAPLLGWALAAVAFGYVLYFSILPWSTTAFKTMQYEIRTQNSQLLLEEGTFNQLGDHLMLFLKKRTSPTQLEQILVHDTRTPAQPVTWYAKSGTITFAADGTPQLMLQNGLRQEVTPQQISMLEFARYTLDIHKKFNPKTVGARQKETEEFSMAELNRMIQTLPAKAPEYRAEMHKRMVWPLAPIPLVLFAAAWLLRPPRRTQGTLRATLAAGLCGIAYMGALSGLSGIAQGGASWALYGQWALLPLSLLAAALISYMGWKKG